ncbi:P-loop ATPase, Sll1717 family [Xanthomonas graminis]|uniref:P-loop ATPase, Sll1717 family n=1 Tax=Xanthomonas graminis TaxID=3390026 RepID=UPI001F3D1EDD|nr:hypothetical protein [Xanthomonas translucens]UKE73030.1 hypothetical protein KFS85_18755 [Xanthomonas translucens pv. phleipratensis]
MSKEHVLAAMDLGASVAEHDRLLSQCFISHPILFEVVTDRKDIVLGAKGAGKSSLWKEFTGNQKSYNQILDVRFGFVTNPAGDPEFRDILAAIRKEDFPDDDELRVAWRLYLLAQFWRNCRDLLPDSDAKNSVKKMIAKYGIMSNEDGDLKQAFAFAVAKARALKNVELKWVEGVAFNFDHELLKAGGSAVAIPFNELISSINELAVNADRRVWLILDRLDEIVLGDESRENSVLKGLLLAYRDLSDWQNLKVKIFLRDDVFDRVTSVGGFPALTHVRSKTAGPIKWEVQDLLHLLIRRLVENPSVAEFAKADAAAIQFKRERESAFYRLFPEKVDKGRAADAIDWIVDRLRDGNRVATPRDLINAVDAARVYQLEEFNREPSSSMDGPLFYEDSIRKSVRKISKDNLETRIYAEYPDLRASIEKFRGGKADHNELTLAPLLGEEWASILSQLLRIGFMYKRTRSGVDMWTIPFFFSFGLDVTRGAAFEMAGANDDED